MPDTLHSGCRGGQGVCFDGHGAERSAAGGDPRPAGNRLALEDGSSAAGPGLSSPQISSQSFSDWLYEVASLASSSPKLQGWCATTPEAFNSYRVVTADGGAVLGFKLPPSANPKMARGVRGCVTEFTHRSRSAMLRWLNSVDRSRIDARRLWFVTLTYPLNFSGEPSRWKRDLDVFRMRVGRAWGRVGFVWKLEFQRRGAPHFHLLLLAPPELSDGVELVGERRRGKRIVRSWRGGRLRDFRRWCSRAWFEVVGSEDPKHLDAGTNVEPCVAWGQVVSYAAKYLGKRCPGPEVLDESTGEVTPTPIGRFWGVYRRKLWPRCLRTESIPFDAWVRIRRVVRKGVLRKRGPRALARAPLRGVCVLGVSSVVSRRLVEWAFPERECASALTRSGWLKFCRGRVCGPGDYAGAGVPSWSEVVGYCPVNLGAVHCS